MTTHVYCKITCLTFRISLYIYYTVICDGFSLSACIFSLLSLLLVMGPQQRNKNNDCTEINAISNQSKFRLTFFSLLL